MSLVINSNSMSLNAQRNLSTSGSALSTAMERLSSGLRINSAADDAAGLAISSRMTTQINGLDQASRNANDGISLAQTAEGAMSEISSNLQRVRELAVQAANATNSDSDRAALDQEVQQRLDEINRIATQTSFNGRKILDGSFGDATFQVGANVGETIGISLNTSMKNSAIGAVASSSSADLDGLFTSGGLTLAAGDLTVDGTSVAAGNYTTAAGLVAAINTAAGSTVAAVSGNEIAFTNTTGTAITLGGAANPLGVTTVAAATTGASTDTTALSTGAAAATAGGLTVAAGTLTVNGTDVAAATYNNVSDLADAINTAAGSTVASVDGSGELLITNSSTSSTIVFGGTDAGTLGLGTVAVATAGATTNGTATTTGVNAAVTATAAPVSVTLATGDFTITGSDGVSHDLAGTYESAQELADAINSISGMTATVDSTGALDLTSADTFTIGGTLASTAVSGGGLGFTAGAVATSGSLSTVNVLTADGANDAMQRIDAALTAVNSLSGTLGAIQNRFQSAINSTAATSENLTSARSRIQDADFAQETSNMTSAQILQQAGVSVLAQANSAQQNILKLLQ